MKIQELKIWQKSMDIVESIYEITQSFPDQEKFGLVSQMRRSAVLLPSNIAEGHGRGTNKEFQQYISIARGSLNELYTQVEISHRLKFVSENQFKNIENKIQELYKMLFSFQKTLNK